MCNVCQWYRNYANRVWEDYKFSPQKLYSNNTGVR